MEPGAKQGDIGCEDWVTSMLGQFWDQQVCSSTSSTSHTLKMREKAQSSLPPAHPSAYSNQGFRDVLIQNAAFGTIPFMFWLHDISDVCGDVTSETPNPGEPRETVPMQPQEKTGS